MSAYKVTPAPTAEDMERWSPVVLVDKYEWGACGNCCPCRGESTYLCGTCCIFPFCCCASPAEVFPRAPTHIKNSKDIIGSFATGGDGKAGLITWKLVRHDDPDWKTEIYGEPHPNKFYAVEIFRNAAAADMYHSRVIFTLPGCDCCQMMTLACRQKFVDIKTVYGDPEECEKAMTYAPALALGKSGVKAGSGRIATAQKTGNLKEWGKEGVPDKAKLQELFGKFHYGWTNRPSLDAVE